MHYSKINEYDIANGPGIRTSLFVSGCENHCKGCFNPETWNKTNGQEFTKETLKYLLDSIDKDYCAGLSLLGGDPFAPYNIDTVAIIMKEFRKRFGTTKTIWLWTGYTIDKILNDKLGRAEAVQLVDVLVDGPFILEKRDLTLKYRGSSNQQVIDIQKSIEFNSLITIE